MENMYQQAIADAKALRASAMANAKAALQEAFEPQIQEMVRLKLSEELEEDENMEEDLNLENETYEEGSYGVEEGQEEDLKESDLEEILAELDELANESESLHEAEGDDADAEDADAEGNEDADAEEDGEETKEITVNLQDLKNIIEELQGLSPELSGEDVEEPGEEEASDSEEVLSLDEILAELENENNKATEEAKHNKHDDEEEEEPVKEAKQGGGVYTKSVKEGSKMHKMEEELEEAKETIEQLRESFNEINLLNAKLLYMNKIFKSKNLTESQKIQVVKSFDRTSSVKEVKNTYEVLKESLSSTKKSQIQESFGYASKPAGVSPKSNVIDSDPFVNRWQKLAGL